MARYHINPETGNPNRCVQTVSCPFGDINDEHWDSKEEALAAQEKSEPDASPLPLPQSDSPRTKLPNPWRLPDETNENKYFPRPIDPNVYEARWANL